MSAVPPDRPAPQSGREPSDTERTIAVGGGAALGATGRWAVGQIDALTGLGWFSPTVLVNLIGCLLIGIAAARADRRSSMWAFAVTGALGGFTTFSAFSVELRGLLADGDGLAAAVFVVLNVVGGLVAFAVGRTFASQTVASQTVASQDVASSNAASPSETGPDIDGTPGVRP